jgi:hypothetical protein
MQFNLITLSICALSFAPVAFSQEAAEEVQPTVTSSAYPTALLQRPFTLPAGTAEVGGKMKLGAHYDENGKTASDIVSLDWVSVGVGVTDDLQFGINWSGFQIPKLNPSRSLGLNAGYFLFANKVAAAMLSLDVPVYFNQSVFRNVTLAMPTAFGIVKNVSLITFYDSLVDVNFSSGKYGVSFNLPLKVGYQVTPNLWLDVSTRVAKFDLGVRTKTSYFWKSAPVKLRGFYAINNAFDVVADVGFDDAFKPTDTFAVVLGLQYRMGNLDG